uniref:Uncharacterized protein n=1 Tax=Anopheles albimanus TaxID=7167 RepID=A0A182FWJ6_ANOAL
MVPVRFYPFGWRFGCSDGCRCCNCRRCCRRRCCSRFLNNPRITHTTVRTHTDHLHRGNLINFIGHDRFLRTLFTNRNHLIIPMYPEATVFVRTQNGWCGLFYELTCTRSNM